MPAFLSAAPGAPEAAGADLLIVPLGPSPRDLHRRLKAIAPGVAQAVARAMDLGDFEARSGQRLLVHSQGFEPFPRILLLGLPLAEIRTPSEIRQAFADAAREPIFEKVDTVAVECHGTGTEVETAVAAAVDGLLYGGYRWSLSTQTPPRTPGRFAFLVANARAKARVDAGIERGRAVADAVNFSRELANTPANHCGPQELAEAALSLAGGSVKVKVLEGAALKKARCEAILAVGRGSARPPRLIVAEYRPRGTANVAPIAIVGKGMIFDTGGLSIKPTSSMVEMKMDKCGGCVTLGTLKGVAALKLPLPVVFVVPAVENSISGDAYRPGDIIGSRAGKTIEVLNTDAEGRLALADGLDYAITEFQPRAILDAATLTGAAMHALSDHACALLGTDESIAARILKAGEVTGERAWQLPLWPQHLQDVETPNADVRNTSAHGGGTIAGAAFLRRFVGEVPWAHLDIANVSRDRRNPKWGATGFGVRLLLETLRTWPTPRPRRRA
jgi:leucyl aminopeptidase